MFKLDRIIAALCTVLVSTTLIVATVGPARADSPTSARIARTVV